MNKKVLIILGVVFIIIMCCFVMCLGLIFSGGYFLNQAVQEVNEDLMYPMCLDIEESNAIDEYFTSSASNSAVNNTEESLSSQDCNDYNPDNNLIESISAGNSVSISTVNGRSTAEYTIFSGSSTYTLNLEKIDGDWLVDSVSVTR